MIRGLIVIGAAVLCAGLGGKSASAGVGGDELSSETSRDLERMQAAAQKSDYSYQQIAFLSNNIGPRLSGSPQAAAAVAYVRQQMLDLGLDVRLEPVTVRHWVRGREEAQLIRYSGQAEGTSQKILVTALGNSVPTPEEGITASVVVVSNFAEFDQLPADQIEGKIVLFNHSFDDFAAQAGRWEQAYSLAVRYRNEGPTRAAKRSAVAALVRSAGSSGFRLPHTGVTKYENDVQPIPVAAVPAEDANLIAALAKQGQVMIHLVLTPHDLAPAQSYNVIADLKGAQYPEQILLVSGHLDSWDLGTGALDDASGVAIAMDVLRIIKQVSPHPRRTIRFVAWMNEENGGAGGRAYAQDHKSELPDHVAAIEIDYGDGRPLGFEVSAHEERFASISPILETIAGPMGGVMKVSESPGSDLAAINQAGVPAMAPLQDARHYFDYHHTAADTFDKVRVDEVRKNVEAISSLVYALAQHD